jgi:hypothetical protein
MEGRTVKQVAVKHAPRKLIHPKPYIGERERKEIKEMEVLYIQEADYYVAVVCCCHKSHVQ